MRNLDAARKEIELLARKSGGKGLARAVVERARDESSALHDFLTWDDSACGDRWRLHEARQLIRNIRVEYRTSEATVISVRRFAASPESAHGEGGYVDVTRIRTSVSRAREVLNTRMNHVLGIVSGCGELAVALGLREELDVIVKDVEALIASLKDEAA